MEAIKRIDCVALLVRILNVLVVISSYLFSGLTFLFVGPALACTWIVNQLEEFRDGTLRKMLKAPIMKPKETKDGLEPLGEGPRLSGKSPDTST